MNFLNEFPDEATSSAAARALVSQPGWLVPPCLLVFVIYASLLPGSWADEWLKKGEQGSRGWHGLFSPVFLQRVALGWNGDCSNPQSAEEMGIFECVTRRLKEN